ncbi:hypothetical protein ACPCVO_50660 [Streptomyces umbrinus]|uniref:hypothetical protein n=1 Tax=Streptomyces umbrinus TaxID=67370 RepID=UPI003C2F86D2
MTRYGFAIKALPNPKGGKPFGDDEDDENEETVRAERTSPGNLESGNPGGELPAAPAGNPPVDPTTGDEPDELADAAAAGSPPSAETSRDPAATGAPPEGEGGDELQPDAPPLPDGDARPWAGDMYSEGDESDPEAAFAAYTGVEGEQAWLDRAPDATLTGWVRDSTSQVWRYTDADAWAADVEGAQMTRTHGPDEEGTDTSQEPASPQQPDSRGVQDQMFAGQ